MPILRTKAPERPYDEIASLHYAPAWNKRGDPAEAERELREQACELGADALIVTREFVPGVDSEKNGSPPVMSATAIVYRRAAAATGDAAAREE